MNRYILKPILLTILLFSSCYAIAQTPGRQYPITVPEMVYVHTDKEIYVAGESIRYKAYLINLIGEKSSCGRIIYFCLTGAGRDNTIDWRINIDSSSASGALKIPENVRPGEYVLTAYTNWMRSNPPAAWFSDRILITSLKAEEFSQVRLFSPQWSANNQAIAGDSLMNLHLSGKEFIAGTDVEVELLLNSHEKISADLSVSVSPVSPFDSLLADEDITHAFYSLQNRLNQNIKAKCDYKIEDRGFILSGRVIPSLNNPDDLCDVWLAVTDSMAPRIVFAPVDPDGTFRFFLNRSYDNKELIIQLADPSATADCRIEIFGKTVLPADTVTHPHFIGISEQNFLSTVKNVRLIEAVYAEAESNTAKPKTGKGSTFLNMPNRVIVPSEYADLNNFREIASNILPEVRFGNRHDEFFLEVLSPNSNTWKDNHMVMLNGVPFTDMAYLSTLGTKEIKRIEVIQPNVMIGSMTLPGLVIIYTYNNKIPENYLRSKTVRYRNTVVEATSQPSSVLKTNQALSSNFPDFRNSLLWEPFLKIHSGNRYKVKFPAGLLTGTYVIRAQGIASNGIPVSVTGNFEVKEK